MGVWRSLSAALSSGPCWLCWRCIAGKPVSADRLIDVLWGDGLAAKPANALQAQIGQLRRTLGAGAIVTTEAGYALAVGPGEVDVVRFGQLVAKGRRLAEAGEMAQASAALGEALGLRRGEPLAEFAYAGFADAERAQLDELTLVAIETRAGADLVLGRHGELAGELEARCREHPLRERLWELLIVALYRAGRQAEALRAYTEVRDRLVGELGIDPGPALRELQARILAQDPSLAAASPAPVRAAAAPVAAGNLRERLSSFVGRDAELEQVREAVRSSRLVTLTGPGGTGKTRLAVEAAAALRAEYQDGAWLVELAGVAAPDGVGPAVAGALGAVASALGEPSACRDRPRSSSCATWPDGRWSLSSTTASTSSAEAAALADTLAGAVPGLRLIATSREPLGIPGEVLVPVGGLAIPAAVELFADRARAVQPGFLADGPAGAVIEDICRRLDGLPLAVELAAARLRALPLATLAERLDDRFRLLTGGARTALPRQQTLRAVVDWSYDLLFEDERRLFARLAVFTGGCELTAAEAICADDQVPAGEILDVLSRLVDKSLVTGAGAGGEARFSQLQTLWQYGRDRLDESGEADAMRARHGAYYRQMADRGPRGSARRHRADVAGPPRLGVGQPAGRARLVHRHAAMLTRRCRWRRGWPGCGSSTATSSKEPAGSVMRWALKGRAVPKWKRPPASGTAIAWACRLSPAAGVIECEEAVAVLRAGDDRVRLAEALVVCATVLGFAHHFDRSLEALGEARDLLEPAGHGWLLAVHDLIVAWNLLSLGRLEDAEPVARSSLERFDAAGRGLGRRLSAERPRQHRRGPGGPRGGLGGLRSARWSDAGPPGSPFRCRSAWSPWPRCGPGKATTPPPTAFTPRRSAAASTRGCRPTPWSARRRSPVASVTCRGPGHCSTRRPVTTGTSTSRPARPVCSRAWRGGRSPPATSDDAAVFAADAAEGASASGDPATQLLADTAVAAVKAIADPTRHNVEAFVALAQRRAQGLAYRSLTDEPDVAALAARLGAAPLD